MKSRQPLIIHLPHASARIPYRDGYVADDRVIENEIKKLTDWFTDDLFHFPEMKNMEVIADFSRVFCDVERFENNADEPMAAFGMGVLYETTDDGSPLRMVTPQLRESVLEEFYRPYHQKFTGVVAAQLEKYGEARIIDAHSFSDIPFFRDLDQSKGRPDICIGTDPFHTPAEWLESAEEFFHSKEISIALNQPYEGTIVPLQYYKKNINVKSMMLEVNRKLYMDEKTTERLASYNRIKMLVAEFLKRIKLC